VQLIIQDPKRHELPKKKPLDKNDPILGETYESKAFGEKRKGGRRRQFPKNREMASRCVGGGQAGNPSVRTRGDVKVAIPRGFDTAWGGRGEVLEPSNVSPKRG